MLLNNREMSWPIDSRSEHIDRQSSNVRSTGRFDAKQHDAAIGRQSLSKRQLAEVLVERDQDARLRDGERQHLWIRCTGSDVAHPGHVMAGVAERLDRGTREVLVREESHRSGPNGKHLFRFESVMGVGEARQNVVARQMRVTGKDFVDAPVVGEKFHHEFDRHARTADHRLADEYRGVDDDAVFPVHVHSRVGAGVVGLNLTPTVGADKPPGPPTITHMLAVFCLRLALGMLVSLALLSPRLMHPRFFRTHFLTVLGLGIVALLMGWSTETDELLLASGGRPWGMQWRRLALIVAAIAPLLGALVWIYERPPLGWTLLVVSILAQLAALVLIDLQQIDARQMISAFPPPHEGPWHAAGLIAGDLTSAALLGFGMTGMLVGHSYLIQPGLSIHPLMGQIAGLGVALVARAAVAGAALWYWAGDHDITNIGDERVLFLPVRWGIGLVGPLIFRWMTYRTAKIRSTQSATGILYVVVILTFLGELTSLLLTRSTGLPL